MLVAVLCFTGCSNSGNELKYDKSSIKESTEFLINYCQSADDATIQQWEDMDDFNLEYQLMQSGLPYTADGFTSALESWQSGIKECGAYVSHGDFKYETSKDELKVTTAAKFKDRDATLTFVYNQKLKLESMTVDGKYSMAQLLKKAGLNTVFLQFDGVTDDVYQTLRGRSMIELKEKAVLNCSEAELGIALVPVIAPGVNDMQFGDILKFAMDHMPFVRGVHFQPISYFGRCSQQRPQAPITIPKMLKLIEEQTEGLMKAEDFAGGGAENPYCSFHASYLKKGERELKLLEKKSGRGCCCTTSDNSRQYVENQWSYSTKKFDDGEMTQTDALDEFLIRVHNETFAVSGMIFQDAWNLDLERLKRCYICEVDSDYGMVPFCAYNLTNSKGIYLYRK